MPYSTGLLPDEMALDYLIILLLLYYISMPRLTAPVCYLTRRFDFFFRLLHFIPLL